MLTSVGRFPRLRRIWGGGTARGEARETRSPLVRFRPPETPMKVLVLGAGVIGTATAWYLARAGHEVTVVERRDGAGLETSFANGGQISVGHAEPWANPGAPLEDRCAGSAARMRRCSSGCAPTRRNGPGACASSRMHRPGARATNIAQMVASASTAARAARAARRDGHRLRRARRAASSTTTRSAPEFEAAREAAGLMRRHGLERR